MSLASLPLPTTTAPASGLPRRLRAVPSEPPFVDDETDMPVTDGAQVLPWIRSLPPTPLTPTRPAPTSIRPESEHADRELTRLFGVQRTPRHELPEPGPRAASAVRILLEVIGGDRPPRQVSAWVAPGLMAGLEHRCSRHARHRPPALRRPLVRSVHVGEPTPGVAEVAAVVSIGERIRAVALRMEGRDGRWVVTDLRVC